MTTTTRTRTTALIVSSAAALLVSSATVLTGAAPAGAASSPPTRHPAMVAAGFGHTLAVLPNGTVRAWGENANGQLGNGSADAVTTPVTVEGLSGSAPLGHVVEVSAAYATSYALLADGTVAAWGLNDAGELGNGSSVDSFRPVRVVSTTGHGLLTGVVSISSAGGYALALRADGTVVAWGYNHYGTFGNGSTTDSAVPVAVHGPGGGVLSHIVSVTAGNVTAYAVTSSGTVYAWGYDYDGSLGNGTSTGTALVPVQVSGVGGTGTLSQVVDVSAGDSWAVALRANGTVVSWGANDQGELGDGTTTARSVPEPVVALGDHIVALARSGESFHEVAIGSSGAVFAWGDNSHGQVGDGTTTEQDTPVRVLDLVAAGVTQVAVGLQHTVAVTSRGTVYVWGGNTLHQLGDGSTVDASSPTFPDSPPTVGLPKLFLLKAPVLSGTAKTGHTLGVTAGTWGLPATSHGYQWLRDGRAIKGATKSSYKLAAADRRHRISVRVSAGRAGYPGNTTTTRSVTVAS